MSSHRNGSDTLQNSTKDTVALTDAVADRYEDLARFSNRVEGAFSIPNSLRPDFAQFKKVLMRHRAGDFRNSNSELKSIRSFAQWLVNENARLRNQKPKKIEWSD